MLPKAFINHFPQTLLGKVHFQLFAFDGRHSLDRLSTLCQHQTSTAVRSCTEPSLHQDTQQHVHHREGSKKNEEQHQNGHDPTLLQVQVFQIFLDFSRGKTWNTYAVFGHVNIESSATASMITCWSVKMHFKILRRLMVGLQPPRRGSNH